jgi:hypothetical protein
MRVKRMRVKSRKSKAGLPGQINPLSTQVQGLDAIFLEMSDRLG